MLHFILGGALIAILAAFLVQNGAPAGVTALTVAFAFVATLIHGLMSDA
ncbi:MAG: hypothetical protein ACXIVE_13885 [Salinarimonas sp.]